MSNNELDNWYKQHIEQVSGPAYSDAYWEKAQAYIARAERIRKLGLANYASLALLLTFFIGAFILQPQGNELPAASSFENVDLSYNSASGENKVEGDDNSQKTDLSVKRTQDQTGAIQNVQTSKSIAVISKPQNTPSIQEAKKRSVLSESVINATPGKAQNAELNNPTVFNRTSESSSEGVASISEVKPDLLDDENIGIIENTTSEKSSDLNQDYPTSNNSFSGLSVAFLPALEYTLLDVGTEFIVLNPFDTDTRSLFYPTRCKWSSGILLSIPSGVLSSDKSAAILGFNLALLQNFEIRDGLKVGAGIGYANRRGDLGIQRDNPASIYDFELIDVGYRIALRELHQLAIPLQISKRLGKTTLHLGYQLNYLLSANGNLESYQSQYAFYETYMTQTTSINTSTYGQVDTQGLNSFSHDIQLRVTYPIGKHLSLGVGASYWLSGYFESDFGVRLDRRTKNYFNAYSPNKAFDRGAMNLELAMYYNL